VLFAVGDTMSQKLEHPEAPLDTGRSVRMTAWGAMFAPLAHHWYILLDRMVPGAGAAVVAKKVLADQLTWTVAINCAFFFTSTLMATGDPAAGVAAIQEKLWPTLKVNWLFWPGIVAINVALVPIQYRILFVNFISLFWSAYLSHQANTSAPAIAAPPSGGAAPPPPAPLA